MTLSDDNTKKILKVQAKIRLYIVIYWNSVTNPWYRRGVLVHLNKSVRGGRNCGVLHFLLNFESLKSYMVFLSELNKLFVFYYSSCHGWIKKILGDSLGYSGDWKTVIGAKGLLPWFCTNKDW